MIQERIRREFNRWADEGRGRGLEKGNWDTTRQLIDLMNVNRHDNVLDLGCGAGWATRVLAQKAAPGIVLGIDLSDRMIAQARTGYRNPHKENVYGHEWARHIDIPVHLLGAEDYLSVLKQAGFGTATHRRIIDSTPLPENWAPTHWFPAREDHLKFKAEGALLLEAEK